MLHKMIVIDNFFNDPFEIRELGLKQEFWYPYDQGALGSAKGEGGKYQAGSWPGKRSKRFEDMGDTLTNLKKDIENKINKRCGLNVKYISARFTLIGADDGELWIHKDFYPEKQVDKYNYAGVIYLSPNPEIGTGTYVYDVNGKYPSEARKEIEDTYWKEVCDQVKDKRYNYRADKLDKENNEVYDDYFIESIYCEAKFNRMFLYDGAYYHGTRWNGSGLTPETKRMTITFFASDFDEMK